MVELPEEEVERVKENLGKQQTFYNLLQETPEFKEQARLFQNWAALCSIPIATCPIHKKELGFPCCGISLEEAISIAGKMVETHARETRRVQEKIKKEHPELELVPFREAEG